MSLPNPMADPLSAAVAEPVTPAINRIPYSTYRIQLRADFGFDDVGRLADYLERLGISDLYLSPLFRSRKESSHGYDVVDHTRTEREFGDSAAFAAMARSARDRGMGILLDVVPNHMGINDPGNRWWNDLLENGEVSRYASYFDIDWHRFGENLAHKILLPLLGDHFGRVLERGEFRIGYQLGRFQVSHYDNQFPLTPPSWPAILRSMLEHLDEAAPRDFRDAVAESARTELESITTQLVNLPPKTDHSEGALRERYREQQVASRRLQRLVDHSPEVREALDKAVEQINGTPGKPSTYDALEALLAEQWYRLAFWRVAADEINYRRFFDINDLAAIRVEQPEVFEAVHTLVERLLGEGQITGLRIDHPDGLLDPRQYFENLQRLYRRGQESETANGRPTQLYVVVEKILSGEEALPPDWPVCGSTGYELLNDFGRLLVSGPGVARLRREYSEIVDEEMSPAQIVYQSQKEILNHAMSSELHVLAGRLHRLAQRHRMSRDFTFPVLLRAMRELIACFPVYRTYVSSRGWEVDQADRARVLAAVRTAKRRNPAMAWTALDFLAEVLLLEYPSADEPDRDEFREFVLKFQQVTGPVTAKGIEDTAFYRYYPLASLNEVGGELGAEPLSVERFHRRMQQRAGTWPHALSATATHDTKRGEDVRARLHVLSEVAEPWLSAVRRWQDLNRPLLRSVGDAAAPSLNEEYLLYQTLVGTWPLAPMNEPQQAEYTERIAAYLLKALREAKVNTSWTNPAEEYEEAIQGFARDLLDPVRSAEFLGELGTMVASIADAGFVNSLAQVVLKCTVPGVPDFYQGTELWDFSLVDPDNRRPVDYAQRRQALELLQQQFADDPAELLRELLEAWPDPRIKLLVVWRALRTRAELAALFQQGDYIPLPVSGDRSNHVVALARRFGERWCIAAASLRVHGLLAEEPGAGARGLPAIDWGDTTIELPADAPRRWKDALNSRVLETELNGAGTYSLPAQAVLAPLPVAILTSAD